MILDNNILALFLPYTFCIIFFHWKPWLLKPVGVIFLQSGQIDGINKYCLVFRLLHFEMILFNVC